MALYGEPVSFTPSLPILAPAATVLSTQAWSDYALLDSGDGRKLERYGAVRVVRPEPQCWWPPRLAAAEWETADAAFDPADEDDQGRWRRRRETPDDWTLAWGEARFTARLTPFRHLAFFPEQEANWRFLDHRIRSRGRPFRLLNLFGYTGVASLVAAAAGAQVTHVDASKRSVGWARENAALSGLQDRPIRWICEDARRYVQREVRRGARYDGVILDPPKYGRGPAGEIWRLFEDLPTLLNACGVLLSDDADFLLLNAYAARISGLSMAHLLREAVDGRGGWIDWGELALGEAAREGFTPRALGLSFFARWSSRP